MEAREESDDSEQLQKDQNNENQEIEFFVLKHVAQGQEAANPGHSTLTAEGSTRNARLASAYFETACHYKGHGLTLAEKVDAAYSRVA